MSRQADTLRRFGVSFDAVYTYIAFGRQKVQGDKDFDPYTRYATEQTALTAMRRDAHLIAGWFNYHRKKWTDDQVERAYAMIVEIQKGPALYWYRLLEAELDHRTFVVARSWAEREWQSPGSVDFNGNEVARAASDAILNVLWEKTGMKKRPAPLDYMRNILCFAFYGPLLPGEKWVNRANEVRHTDVIDL